MQDPHGQDPVRRQHFLAPITYLLLLERAQSVPYSPFQGFSPGFLARVADIPQLLTLPATLLELYHPRYRAMIGRIRGIGAYQIIPVQVESLPKFPCARFPFTVIIDTEGTHRDALAFLEGTEQPLMLCSTDSLEGSVPLHSVTRTMLLDHCISAVEYFKRQGDTFNLPPHWRSVSAWLSMEVPYTCAYHNVAYPNEAVFRSFALEPSRHRTALPPFRLFEPDVDNSLVNTPHVDIIEASSIAVRELRHAVMSHAQLPPARMGTELVVTAPSVYNHLAVPSERTQSASERDERVIVRALLRQESYTPLFSHSDKIQSLLQTQQFQQLMGLRQDELTAYTWTVAAEAAGRLAPVIRLPPSVNKICGSLHQLSSCLAGRSLRKGRKLSRLARRIDQELRRCVDPRLLAILEETRGGVKLVTDAPLELLRLDGLPMAIARECSRITTTPGNLFARQLLANEVEVIEVKDLRRILVVRTYANDDPARPLLRMACEQYQEQAQHPAEVRWADVSTVDQLVDSLNGFDGHIAVFDGHGVHPTDGHSGLIQIGGDMLNPWELYGRARFPSIIVLSACETHPLDGRHATVANALLACGAKAVVGTLGPVLAAHSAVFVGRLLFRLMDYLPVLRAWHQPVRWSDVICGLFRMSYVTDVVRQLQSCGLYTLSGDDFREIVVQSNTAINSWDPEWFEISLDLISTRARLPLPTVKAAWAENAYFTESLQYIQLGRPENILLVDSEQMGVVPGSGEAVHTIAP